MNLRYIILLFSIIFLSFLFISLNADPITQNTFYLGGKTFSPLKKDNAYYYNQSVFLTQEGKHKLIVGTKAIITDKIIATPNTDTEDIPVITGIEDIPSGQENLPPSSILADKMYGDVGYTPGFDPVEYFKNYKQKNNTDASTVANIWGTTPLTGNYHIPVLLVEFADFSHTLSSSVFQDQFNSNFYLDGNGTSVKKYYYKESYGALNITYDIYEWRTLTAHTYTWYGTGNNGAYHFVLDTMNLFGTGSNPIDFTQYDSDNDGRIDGVIMLHAGYSGQQMGAGHIGSQTRLFVGTTGYVIQGKYYGNIAIVPEKTAQSICNNYLVSNYPIDCRGEVQTEVHEFAHVLGLPDLYQINPNTGAQVGVGLGDITMMADQAALPQKPINFDAWSRYFFGWITPTTISDSSMSGNYNIYSIDTNPNAAYILKDSTKMNSREYFLVTNRHVYQSPNNQDRWLFGGLNGISRNKQGGLEILHVDEAYIESQYPTNSVMYDEDMNMYNDTVSHPGIVFEQNVLGDWSNNQMLAHIDLYTNEWNNYFSGISDFGIFDNIARLSPSSGIFWDTTSKTYNGLQDTGVKVQALSAGGYTVTTYLQSEFGPFNANITNPKNNKWYKHTSVIDFTENHNNNIGDVSCVWKKTGDIVISNDCSFSASPQSLGINSTGCSPNSTPITLTITDLETSTQVTDTVNIRVYVKFTCEQIPVGNGQALPD